MTFGRKPSLPSYRPSRALVASTYRLLMHDRWMVLLLLAGGLLSAVAFGAIAFPAWYFGHVVPASHGHGLLGTLVWAVALWAASFVSVLTTGAVVAAALLRSEGRPVTAREALALAWSRRGPLAAWALLGTVVGLLMNLLERFGLAGVVVRLLAGVSWAVATVFAVPVLITEGTMPLATVRRSAGLVRDTFAVSVRSNVRLALPWTAAMVVAAVVLVGGGACLSIGLDAHRFDLVVDGGAAIVVGWVVLCVTGAVSTALSAYLSTLLFRYATGRPVPGLDPADLPPLRSA